MAKQTIKTRVLIVAFLACTLVGIDTVTTPARADDTRIEQVHFPKGETGMTIKGRNDCWKSDDMHDCVAGQYRSRIDELKDC